MEARFAREGVKGYVKTMLGYASNQIRVCMSMSAVSRSSFCIESSQQQSTTTDTNSSYDFLQHHQRKDCRRYQATTTIIQLETLISAEVKVFYKLEI